MTLDQKRSSFEGFIRAEARRLPLNDIYPQWRNATIATPGDGFTMIRSDVDYAYFLPGTDSYERLCRLTPMLTGACSLEQICEANVAGEREEICRLICHLLDRGYLRNNPLGDIRQFEKITQTFQEQIELIAHLADQPLARFARFRRSRVLLVGSGEPFVTCAASLIRYGLERLVLLNTSEIKDDLSPVWQAVRELQEAGQKAIAVTLINELKADLLEWDYGLVALATDRPVLREFGLLNRLCYRQSWSFLPAASFAGRTVMGPLLTSNTPGCWVCGLIRISGEIGDERWRAAFYQFQALGYKAQPPELDTRQPMERILGTDLAFEMFKWLAGGIRPLIEWNMIVQTPDRENSFEAKLVTNSICFCLNACRRFYLENDKL